MNIGVINTSTCVNRPPGPDTRCDDPAYALAHPETCPESPRFIIKPGVLLLCELGSVQLGAFTVVNGIETDVTNQTVFTTSSPTIIGVTSAGGNATGFTAGAAIITGTYQGQSASVDVVVLEGANCCDEVSVAMMVMVDQTRSMSQCFSGTGGGCQTKLAYARTAAQTFIDGVNETKDAIGLARFTEDSTVVLSAPIADKAAVSALVTPANIAQTQLETEFYDAIATGIAALDGVTADRKVLIIISDGEDTALSYAQNNPIELTDNFKAQGGIVICLGIRSHGGGYSLLSKLATGGFFLNAYQSTADESLDYLVGLRGYICGGSCAEDGDGYEYRGALDYDSLTNFDLIYDAQAVSTDGTAMVFFGAGKLDPLLPSLQIGAVDLLGNGFFDYLPNNGLYVDLFSSGVNNTVSHPMLLSKQKYALTPGTEYRLSVNLAGPQMGSGGFPPMVVFGAFNVATGEALQRQNVLISDHTQGFTNYALTFTAPDPSVEVKILVWQAQGYTSANDASGQLYGALLGEVQFEEVGGTMLLHDDFNTENPIYIGPKCGQGTTYVEIGVEGMVVPIPELAAPTDAIVATPIADGSGTMIDESGGGYLNSLWYNYTFVTAEGETTDSPTSNIVAVDGAFTGAGYNAATLTLPTVLDSRVLTIRIYRSITGTFGHANHLLPEVAAGTPTFLDTETQSVWDARAAAELLAGETIRPTVNTTESSEIVMVSSYGYTSNYDCYGDGCLDAPPPSQLADPNPLPNLETGAKTGNFSASATGCAQCPPGFINGGEVIADATTLADGADTVTVIQLDDASGIKRFEIEFLRAWNLDFSSTERYLSVYGSNDNATWTQVFLRIINVGGTAGLVMSYSLPSESATYEYFRVTIASGTGPGAGKVLGFAVFTDAPSLVCRDATASGATPAAALQNALASATQAARDALNCVPVYTATAVYIAPDGTTAVATATSENSANEAQQVAAAEAQSATEV